MAEAIFTIFEGPDKGRQFVLKDTPLGMGRDPDREIHLHDERASRFHASLVLDGEDALLVDQDSSNGTFVNGALIDRCVLHAGDVITIANTKIIFSAEAPDQYHPSKGFHALSAKTVISGAIGSTRIIASRSEHTRPEEPSRPIEVLQAVADAAGPLAEPLGVHLSVEADTDDRHRMVVSHQALYRNLATLLEILLRNISPSEGTLALRLSHDQLVGRGQVEILACAVHVNREQIQRQAAKGAFRDLWGALHTEGCSLVILPVDSPDILARIYLPEVETGH